MPNRSQFSSRIGLNPLIYLKSIYVKSEAIREDRFRTPEYQGPQTTRYEPILKRFYGAIVYPMKAQNAKELPMQVLIGAKTF